MGQIIGYVTITASNGKHFDILKKVSEYAFDPDAGKWLCWDLEISDDEREINLVEVDISAEEMAVLANTIDELYPKIEYSIEGDISWDNCGAQEGYLIERKAGQTTICLKEFDLDDVDEDDDEEENRLEFIEYGAPQKLQEYIKREGSKQDAVISKEELSEAISN